MKEKNINQCTLEELCFPVEINPNPRKTNKEYCMVVTGWPNGVEMDLNYCSDIYTLVKNKDIFPNIEQILFNNAIDFSVKYYHINFVRFYADYTITDDRYTYRMKETNDLIQPLIRVQHSYNGLTKYRIHFGYYRLVCSNGLTIPVKELEKFNLEIVGKHTFSIHESLKLFNQKLIYFSNNAKEITKTIIAHYEKLNQNVVSNLKDKIENVLNGIGITIVENSKFNTIENITQRIQKEANNPSLGYNGKITDWLVYNGINQYIFDYDRYIAVPEVRIEKDQKLLNYMLS